MRVIVLNAGSTSLKYQLFEMDREETLISGVIERIGSSEALHRWRVGAQRKEAKVKAPDPRGALDAALGVLGDARDVRAVGHRVVHGGEKLIAPALVTDEVKATIRACAAFAPLHNPANLAGIEAAQAALPDAVHVAVFDTAFHAQLPEHAYIYGLPYELYLAKGIRRYGFHGPSHQYMALRASEFLRTDLARLKLITCHLGGGASVCAIDGGRSVDTSMGMTPLEGLIMGTRPGDLDPGLYPMLPGDAQELLNKHSGVLGISGVSADFRDLERAADEGHTRARLAVDAFVHRLRKYVGAYAAVLGGADAIVLSGGIGENAARVRAALCEPLVYMGVDLDDEANVNANAGAAGGVVDIARPRAPTRVLVVATNEELMIARDAARVVAGPTAARRAAGGAPIPVGVSVRHVHLSRAHCDALFGKDYELTLRREVSQPGQYVTRETVDLVGPRGELRGVAIIAPLRQQTQIELARSDAIALGVNPPLRESGKLDGSPGLTVRGPHGQVELERGVILAHRHVHMSPDDARRFGVEDGAMIKLRVDGDRETVFGDVLVRVSPAYALDLHLDTDEANAAGLNNDSVASFEGVQ
jgi:acetate kinase